MMQTYDSLEEIKASVIIPMYNTEAYIRECMESALAQTLDGVEIIVVDDGSTDRSLSIARQYEEANSSLRVITQKNGKQGSARNRGIREARGKYLYFLDSDDYISTELLEKCHKISEESDLDFLMFDAHIVGNANGVSENPYDRSRFGIEDKIYTGIEFYRKFYQNSGIIVSPCLLYIKKDFLTRHRLFFQERIYYEDNDWMVRMLLCGEKIMYLKNQLYYRRLRGESTVRMAYTKMHLVSVIAECKSLFRLLAQYTGQEERGMLLGMLNVMLHRLMDILKSNPEFGDSPGHSSEIMGLFGIYNSCSEPIHENALLCRNFRDLAEMMNFEDWPERETYLHCIEEDAARMKKCFVEEAMRLPFSEEGITIGIYGYGRMWAVFQEQYKIAGLRIRSRLMIVDSYRQSGISENGQRLVNIHDIEEGMVDGIMIASFQYAEAMRRECEPLRLPIYMLPMATQYFLKG